MIPQIVGYLLSPVVKKDVRRWRDIYGLDCGFFSAFVYIMTYHPQFRNLMYKRLKIKSIITPPYLACTSIRMILARGCLSSTAFQLLSPQRK